jgi:hypothetical protein
MDNRARVSKLRSRETTTSIAFVFSPSHLAFAVVCGVVFTLCDAVHVYTGTLSYAHPLDWLPLPQPWFVFPLFFIAGGLGGALARTVSMSMLLPSCNSNTKGDASSAVEGFFGLCMTYVLTGFANRDGSFLTVLLFSGAVFRLLVAPDRTYTAVFAAALALVGVLTEGSIVFLGEMQYRQSDFLGTPLWLPLLYVHAAISMREALRYFI